MFLSPNDLQVLLLFVCSDLQKCLQEVNPPVGFGAVIRYVRKLPLPLHLHHLRGGSGGHPAARVAYAGGLQTPGPRLRGGAGGLAEPLGSTHAALRPQPVWPIRKRACRLVVRRFCRVPYLELV